MTMAVRLLFLFRKKIFFVQSQHAFCERNCVLHSMDFCVGMRTFTTAILTHVALGSNVAERSDLANDNGIDRSAILVLGMK
jgi:hypothetical protein